MPTAIIPIVVVDDLLRALPTVEPSKSLPAIPRRMTKPMHQRLNALKSKGTCSYAGSRLHRTL